MTDSPDTRLATYGTLAPGRINNHELAGLRGTWKTGWIRGHLDESGWGADLGYPGIVPDPAGERVKVFLFESPDLPQHWDRLDAFEGPGYRRVAVDIITDEGTLAAFIYSLQRA